MLIRRTTSCKWAGGGQGSVRSTGEAVSDSSKIQLYTDKASAGSIADKGSGGGGARGRGGGGGGGVFRVGERARGTRGCHGASGRPRHCRLFRGVPVSQIQRGVAPLFLFALFSPPASVRMALLPVLLVKGQVSAGQTETAPGKPRRRRTPTCGTSAAVPRFPPFCARARRRRRLRMQHPHFLPPLSTPPCATADPPRARLGSALESKREQRRCAMRMARCAWRGRAARSGGAQESRRKRQGLRRAVRRGWGEHWARADLGLDLLALEFDPWDDVEAARARPLAASAPCGGGSGACVAAQSQPTQPEHGGGWAKGGGEQQGRNIGRVGACALQSTRPAARSRPPGPPGELAAQGAGRAGAAAGARSGEATGAQR